VNATRVDAPDLSVLIVTYQCAPLVDECLRSIGSDHLAPSIEVVVADNASSDGVVELLRLEHPLVTVVEMGANTGFSRANNAAAARSRGRNLLLLNPDTLVQPGALRAITDALDAPGTDAIVAPRLLNSDGTDQGTARSFPTPAAAIFGRRSPLTRAFPRNPWSRRFLTGLEHTDGEPFNVDWVSGAALGIRRSAFEELGGLDEGFFMHFEDADLCHRAKDRGWTVLCLSTAAITHAEGGSRRGWPVAQVRHFHYGAYRYWTKHHVRARCNPLRALAACVLTARALLVVVRDAGARATSRRVHEGVA
jgi:N-acetylglucosaminyl-diphospho-decaprenol L-rhamnosyltransferase